MKINKSGIEVKAVSKYDTKVGEVYTDGECALFYLRCQGGFVNLASGSYLDFSEITDNVRWRHLPDATLVVNG